jgi:hypothetical protein
MRPARAADGSSAATSSSPVGITATRGRRWTGTAVTPDERSAATSGGPISRPPGRTISLAARSSPASRMCCHGLAASTNSAAPSGSQRTSSIITTASNGSGIGSPVSTTVNASGVNWTGRVSAAWNVWAARTARPSIADAWKWGTERAANTGSAVTRPADSAVGTGSAGRAAGTTSGLSQRRSAASRLIRFR